MQIENKSSGQLGKLTKNLKLMELWQNIICIQGKKIHVFGRVKSGNFYLLCDFILEETFLKECIMKNTKVSVIMPVYNAAEYLRDTMECLINQTLEEIEVICVDDGSTDKSLDILNEYAMQDNRILVLPQKNLHAGCSKKYWFKSCEWRICYIS